jgi:protein AbiQ
LLLLKLEPLFFDENKHLVEVLDKQAGEWNGGKERGYGILVISHKDLRFGIPLRSHIKHTACFLTNGTKGRDYSKSVILVKDDYISTKPFTIPSDEYVKIKDRTQHITKQFEKYVSRYVIGVRRSDDNILRPYRFSTLQNYHGELGL